MDGFTFVPTDDTTPETLFSGGHFMCDKCGKIVQRGLMNIVTHASECHVTTVQYKVATDNEMREFFMEIGMPDMGFEGLGFAKPTEMERKIFKK